MREFLKQKILENEQKPQKQAQTAKYKRQKRESQVMKIKQRKYSHQADKTLNLTKA